MFFGGAFFQNGGPRRRFVYRTYRADPHNEEREEQRGERTQRGGGSKILPLLQFLPLLIIVISSFAFNFTKEEPLYSLQQTFKFNIPKYTTNLKVQYFVDSNFRANVEQKPQKLKAVNENIERDYVGTLRDRCRFVKQRVYNLERAAAYSTGQTKDNYLREAKSIDLSSCSKVNELQTHWPHLLAYY